MLMQHTLIICFAQQLFLLLLQKSTVSASHSPSPLHSRLLAEWSCCLLTGSCIPDPGDRLKGEHLVQIRPVMTSNNSPYPGHRSWSAVGFWPFRVLPQRRALFLLGGGIESLSLKVAGSHDPSLQRKTAVGEHEANMPRGAETRDPESLGGSSSAFRFQALGSLGHPSRLPCHGLCLVGQFFLWFCELACCPFNIHPPNTSFVCF